MSGVARVIPTAPAGPARYEHLISNGEIRPLESVPFHAAGPLARWQMAGRGVHDDPPFHVAVHEISDGVPREARDYCQLHQHDFAEVNLLLSPSGLTYRIELGDEAYEVTSPASILIPPHLPHSANLLEGAGFFIAILACETYEASVSTRTPARDHEVQ